MLVLGVSGSKELSAVLFGLNRRLKSASPNCKKFHKRYTHTQSKASRCLLQVTRSWSGMINSCYTCYSMHHHLYLHHRLYLMQMYSHVHPVITSCMKNLSLTYQHWLSQHVVSYNGTSTGILMYADVAIISMLHTLRLVLLVT